VLVTRRASARVFSDGRGRHRCSLLVRAVANASRGVQIAGRGDANGLRGLRQVPLAFVKCEAAADLSVLLIAQDRRWIVVAISRC
jgi:hypothetical protein